ncbi:MAG: DUF1573 domain-containing protein [Muribaculaceae bacterium]|nr:DUF1573 domain-containing protein [Muribaculaceae bacterium]
MVITLFSLAALAVCAQPQATWLEQVHDFGVFMEKDGKVTCAMRVVNTGNDPLLIIKAQAGCGCTGINYPEAPIQPGDTAVVNITYNPSGRPGQFNKQAIIFTNTVTRRSVLEITGNVIPSDETLDKQYPLRAGSLRISHRNIPFGELTRGKNKTEYLSAYNASTDTLLVRVTGDKQHLRPAFVPDTVPPARVTALTVHYISKHAPQWGLNVDTLTLSCEPLRQPSDAEAGSTAINVMAQVIEDFDNLSEQQRREAPALSVDCGDRIDFGAMKTGETIGRTFTITNKGKSPLIIRRLWVPDDEGVTVKADRTEVKRGKTATVTVTVNTAQVRENLLNVPLTLLCNDPEIPRLTVRLVGIIDQE